MEISEETSEEIQEQEESASPATTPATTPPSKKSEFGIEAQFGVQTWCINSEVCPIPNRAIDKKKLKKLKSKSIRIKDIKILLKEIINSEKLSQDELKLIAAELEYNDKKNSTEILGISQNPFTLNYIIVVDFLFSGNLYI
ncbi:hypothetical protein RhiirA4_444930 [Rhizophagus irregularis]|uniref:Uncharacterized protein n=1 Tax=Rhizophagus irregularis TaxID=588596 RepID=A0A2I1GLW0_9GLOM|nr:hypothetical protein RhiirA4_444930 [Rhizophagus irregularis]